MAGPFADLKARIDLARSDKERLAVMRGSGIQDEELERLVSEADSESPTEISKAVDYVELRAIAEGAQLASDQSVVAKRIKSSPAYRDEGATEEANWLSGAIERLKNLRFQGPERRPQFAGAPAPALGFLVYLMWALLVALVLGFLIYVARFVTISRSKKRRGKAMLEETEPERTLDEWLQLADAYERERRYREAVRALYLACLLKFDEKNVARFIRAQTNWEHLARIEASPRKPVAVDFKPATQAFDQIWYGHKVKGPEDVDAFRGWYQAVTESLRGAAA